MSKPSRKVPELRFKGFTQDWERRKLGDLMDFSNGINAPKESYGKGRKMISVLDILADTPIVYEDILNSVEVDYKTEIKNKVENGDLVFVRSSEVRDEVGWVKAYRQEQYALYSGFSIRGKKTRLFDAKFIELFLNHSGRQQIESRAGGSTRFNVSQSILNDVLILEPSLKEQLQISCLFEKLEQAIELHKRKYDALLRLKDAYLQNIFPSKGESVPKMRFTNFDGKWEQRKLKNCFDERNERGKNGELISVTLNSGVVKTETLNRKDNSSSNKSNYKKVEVGDLAYNSMRMWQGASGLSSYSGIVSPAYTILIPKEDISALFFSYQFKLEYMTYIFQANSQGLTSDTWNLKYPVLKNIKIYVPSLEEQLEIGRFFQQIDCKIEHIKSKLDKLNLLKQAYLQKMFI